MPLRASDTPGLTGQVTTSATTTRLNKKSARAPSSSLSNRAMPRQPTSPNDRRDGEAPPAHCRGSEARPPIQRLLSETCTLRTRAAGRAEDTEVVSKPGGASTRGRQSTPSPHADAPLTTRATNRTCTHAVRWAPQAHAYSSCTWPRPPTQSSRARSRPGAGPPRSSSMPRPSPASGHRMGVRFTVARHYCCRSTLVRLTLRKH